MSNRSNLGVLASVGALFAAGAAMPASAESPSFISIKSFSVENLYSYSFDGAPPPSTIGGERSTIVASDQRPVPTSQLGVDYVGQASADSFYFLHNDYCVGQCQITSSTTIRFEITNDFGEDLEGLRFDSLITPGHLAFVGVGSYENTAASFSFAVNRIDQPDGESFPVTTTLYSARGAADIFGLQVEADGVSDPFRGTLQGNNDGAGLYYDWSATPLQVGLGSILAGQTIYLDYTATYTVRSFNTCDDILNCNAAQVVFGDPRSNGGGSELAAASMARAAFGDLAIMDSAADPIVDGGVHPVINRNYQATYIPYAVVQGTDGNGDPTPFSFTLPEPSAPRSYIGNYVPALVDTVSGVPEPATWASMVLGLGIVGRMLRRRRAGSRVAA